ncbi:MAG: thiamine pyrophosphate-binding protein [Kiritimatiellae bacterium]|jgi:acetolactate synthase-1/2/3 large subunit|nr:thiamine pyrophosphate-binding protein [Kiritimatiellia bacterium]
MTVAEYIADELCRRGIERVFEVTGGMITFLIDALYRDGRVQVVSLRHEQSAAMAADVYGRLTGKPGVALATSGPGATNLLTGIAGAYFDSSPAVFITGQVNRNEQRCQRNIRQQGFQETDIVAMACPVTKAAWRVKDAEKLPQMLEDAFALAFEGRPGPVLLDIPMDIQRQELADIPDFSRVCNETISTISPPIDAVRLAVSALATASQPLILAGGGIRAANAVSLFRSWIGQIKVPVVHSLMGVDVLPSESPYRIGLIGTNGNRWANKALVEADMLFVIGSRLDIRQTGADISEFRNRPIIHVDCIDGQVNNRIDGCTSIIGDIGDLLPLFQKISKTINWVERKKWVQSIDDWHRQRTDCDELGEAVTLNPNVLIRKATAAFPGNRVIVTDVGQNQMWVAQSALIHKNERFLSPGGLGAMGFALPAAISAAMEFGETLLVAGDGGFQMNIQELQSVAQQALPLRMIVLNNQCLGMVRQFQDAYFDGRLQSTVWGYSAPDFEKVSLAYGIPSRTLTAMEGCDDAFIWMKAQKGPCLLQVMLDQKTDLLPKVKFGKPLSQMDPVVRFLD